MQKLTYINLRNEQAVFYHAPYVLSRIDGLGLPDLKIETMSGVYQQGSTIVGFRRENRVISLTFHIVEQDRAALYARRMELLNILSPDKAARGDARAVLIYENDYIRSRTLEAPPPSGNGMYMTYAVPDGGLNAKSRILDTQPDLKISFRCESPFWYAVNPSSVAFTYTGEGFMLPYSFPVAFGFRNFTQDAINEGQVDAPVEIAIRCRGEVPHIFNQTTGKRISMNAAVPSGNTLVLNTDPARLDAKIIDASGGETGAFGKLSLETPLADFTLRPGINRLVYEAGGAEAQSEISVTWRNAYEGV
jgi:hypothetical protein